MYRLVTDCKVAQCCRKQRLERSAEISYGLQSCAAFTKATPGLHSSGMDRAEMDRTARNEVQWSGEHSMAWIDVQRLEIQCTELKGIAMSGMKSKVGDRTATP